MRPGGPPAHVGLCLLRSAGLPRIAWNVVGLIAAGLAATDQASAPSDTAEARRAAAEEFLTSIPVAGEVDDLIRQMSEEVIQNQREAFVAQMRQRVDITYMKQVMLDGLVTGLSARELRAAAVFYGTPEGKAIRETEGDRRHHAPDSKGARSDG